MCIRDRDLCMIEHMDDVLTSGIDSLKIEGRMKTALYVATVARTYRKAIDDYLESPELYREHMPWYQEQIRSCTYRQFTTGFFYGKPDEDAQIYENNTYAKGYTYLGYIEEQRADGMYRITQRNKFLLGETIEKMCIRDRDLTLSIELSEILTVFMKKILPNIRFVFAFYKHNVTVYGKKSQYQKKRKNRRRLKTVR